MRLTEYERTAFIQAASAAEDKRRKVLDDAAERLKRDRATTAGMDVAAPSGPFAIGSTTMAQAAARTTARTATKVPGGLEV